MPKQMRIIISRLGPEPADNELEDWRLQLEELAGGEETCDTHAPFSRRELSIVLRSLDVNRGAASAFTPEEVARLREWGVVSDDVPPAVERQVVLGEPDIDLKVLLNLVQSRLYACLFPSEATRQLLHSAVMTTPPNEVLHVRLQADRREALVFQQPWEVLCYAGAQRWSGRRVSISRYLAYDQAVPEPLSVDQLRVLVITSRPRDLPSGASADRTSIIGAATVANVQLDDLPQATFRALSDYLFDHKAAGQPQVIHFDGHGAFGRVCGQGHLTTSTSETRCAQCNRALPPVFAGYLAFQREDGLTNWVSGDDLADKLRDFGVRLVVLNACQAGVARRGADVFNGAAHSLLRSVPAVVATQFRLDWEGATRFADYFYRGLMAGEALIEVLDRTRQALYGQDGILREWYRPALYLRQRDDGGGRLFRVLAAATPATDTTPVVYLYNFGDNRRPAGAVEINWARYFDQQARPRRVPTLDVWSNELWPELLGLRKDLGHSSTIHILGTGALSSGLAIGHVFSDMDRYRLEFTPHPATPDGLWRSDAPLLNGHSRPHFAEHHLEGDPAKDDAVLIVHALGARPPAPVVTQIGAYLGEPDLFQALSSGGALDFDKGAVLNLLIEGFSEEELRTILFDLSEFGPVNDQLSATTGKATIARLMVDYADQKMLYEPLLEVVKRLNPRRYERETDRIHRQGRSRRFKGCLLLEREPKMMSGWEAAELARASKGIVAAFVGRHKPKVLHLFLATPLGLAVFLGHQWSTLGTRVQCYEWVDASQYAPVWSLML